MPYVFVGTERVEIPDAAAHGDPLGTPIGHCQDCGVSFLVAQGHNCQARPTEEEAISEAAGEQLGTEA